MKMVFSISRAASPVRQRIQWAQDTTVDPETLREGTAAERMTSPTASWLLRYAGNNFM
jgi:hypothetical protein